MPLKAGAYFSEDESRRIRAAINASLGETGMRVYGVERKAGVSGGRLYRFMVKPKSLMPRDLFSKILVIFPDLEDRMKAMPEPAPEPTPASPPRPNMEPRRVEPRDRGTSSGSCQLAMALARVRKVRLSLGEDSDELLSGMAFSDLLRAEAYLLDAKRRLSALE